MLRKLSALLTSLGLVAALTPWASAAGGLKLVTASQEADRQQVGFSGVATDSQSFQATFTLSNPSNGTTYDFFTNDALITTLPGLYTTYKQEGSTLTVYFTTKTGTLTDNGTLILGTLTSDDGSAFTVEKATGVKVVGSDYAENTYSQVDENGSSGGSSSGGGGSSGGSSSGGSSSGGNSSSSTDRAITIQSSFGGKVTASAAQAASGKTVTLTALPNEGYFLKSLTVTTASGSKVSLTNQGDGKYTFTMPAAAVLVQAVFAAQEPQFPFVDVPQDSWYYAGVSYAYEHGLMSGTGADTFSPDLPTSRGMLVTILYRLAGSPSTGTPSFTDVSKGQWYADGVAWASANGVVSGYPDNSFRPNDPITREQMAAILYQFARLQNKLEDSHADLSGYVDADAISAYAVQPMAWAVSQGLISGLSTDTLGPGGSTTRAQAAVILTAFSKSMG